MSINWQVLSCLALAATLPLSAAHHEESALVDIPYEKFVLDNGLTLIVHEDHKTPVVAVNVWYHVGSKNEQPGKTGFAHLFEHLMFNGSENFNDDYFQAMERIGATDLNGTTNSDRTNYFQNVPTTALDVALWMESDRMGYMVGAIDQEKLDEQRGVVQNEKRQGQNQPYAIAYDIRTKNTYPAGHPYSWTVIGEMEDLNAAELDDVHEWFKNYYGAANAVLVLAGDIDAATAREKVEKYFGHIPSGPPVQRQQEWIAKRTGEHRQTVEDRVPQARVYLTWNTPGWGTEETAYLDLTTDVLALGKNSRLYKRLVYEEQIASSVSSSIYPREIGGQVTITATALPGKDLGRIEEIVREELAKYLKEGPESGELARVVTQHQARFIRGLERIGGFGGKADILAQNQVYGGTPDHYKKYEAWIAGAKPSDLRETAVKWLSDGVHVLEVHPFPEHKNGTDEVDRSKLPEVSGFPSLDLPDVQRITLSNGLKVALAERHDIPTVDFRLVVDAGYAADQFATPGTASLTMAMVDEGTDSRSSLEISDQLARLGGRLGSGAGLDTCAVTLSALKMNLAETLDIYADVIMNPSFPQGDLDRLRQQQLAAIRQEKSNPIQTAIRLLPGLVFGKDHAYGAPLSGSGNEESVSALTREDLEKFHGTWFQPSNATLIVAGDTTLDELRPLLEEKLKGWKTTGEVPKKNLSEVAAPEKRVVYLVDKPAAQQSVIIAGIPAPPTNNPDEIAIDAMNQILGGSFTSRINMNLREEKHWAYGARSLLTDAQGQRMYLTYAPVQTDKTKESMAEIDKEMRQLLDSKPATADELAKVKVNQTSSLPGRFETKSALMSAIQESIVYGIAEDFYETLPGKVEALELEDIQEAAGKLVHPDRLVWVVVGDKEKIAAGVDELGYGEMIYLTPDGDVIE